MHALNTSTPLFRDHLQSICTPSAISDSLLHGGLGGIQDGLSLGSLTSVDVVHDCAHMRAERQVYQELSQLTCAARQTDFWVELVRSGTKAGTRPSHARPLWRGKAHGLLSPDTMAKPRLTLEALAGQLLLHIIEVLHACSMRNDDCVLNIWRPCRDASTMPHGVMHGQLVHA